MKARILGYSDKMTYDDWLALRRTGLCGSDAAAVAGVSKRRTRIGVYLDKLGDLPPDDKEWLQEVFYWGHVQEPIIRKEFAKRSGLKVKKCNAMLQHPEYPWLLANIDGLVQNPDGGEEGLECKNVSSFLASQWEGDSIPEDYQLQCYHYMLVTGLRRWWIAALIGGNKFVYKSLDWDQEVIDSLFQMEAGFWKLVESRSPPALDGSDASGELLQRLYSDTVNQEICLPPDYEILCRELMEARQAVKQAEEMKSLKQHQLQAALGEYERAKVGDFTVRWQPTERTVVEIERLKAEHPDIYRKFAKVVTYRRFSIK